MLAVCRRSSRNSNSTPASQKSFGRKQSDLQRSSRAEAPEKRTQSRPSSNGLHKDLPALRSASPSCVCDSDADELLYGSECNLELQPLALSTYSQSFIDGAHVGHATLCRLDEGDVDAKENINSTASNVRSKTHEDPAFQQPIEGSSGLYKPLFWVDLEMTGDSSIPATPQ